MAEAISRARLMQIAQRKLAALGIPFKAEGDEIRGDLVTGAYGLKNPATGARIETVRFEVEGHDRLRFLEPAFLRDVPSQPFYDQENVGAIVNQLASTLDRRHSAAQATANRMRQLGFDVAVDPARLVATVRIELPGLGTAVLEGTEKGLVAARVLAPQGSTRPPISLGNQAIDLREYPDRVDLELHVGTLADRAVGATDLPAPATYVSSGGVPEGGVQGGVQGGAQGGALFASLGEIHAADDTLESMRYFAGTNGPRGSNAAFAGALGPPRPAPTPPPVAPAALPGLPLEALGRAFGGEAIAAGPVTLIREVRHGGQVLQLVARQEGPRSFAGRITGPAGVVADVRFDLEGFPGVEQLVAQRLAQVASAPPAPPVIPGQVWVMDVRVDGEDAAGIRYTMLNAGGSATGSPKVLRRPEFEATFAMVGGKPRLLAKVLEAAGGHVAYVQLDPRRQPVGGARRSSLGTFTGTFRPEG